MSAAHTPGPWVVECFHEDGYSIHGEPLDVTGIKAGIATRIGKVTEVFEGTPPNAGWQPIPEEMNLANAHLIAAAPDLLKALELTLQELERAGCGGSHLGLTLPSFGVEAARAAITKATGGAA